MFAVPRAPERHGVPGAEEERGGVESGGTELSGKERGGVARIRAGEGIRSAALGRRMRQRAAHPDLLQHQFVRSWMVDLARKNRCWRRSGHAPVFCAASGRSPTGRAASRVCVCVCVCVCAWHWPYPQPRRWIFFRNVGPRTARRLPRGRLFVLGRLLMTDNDGSDDDEGAGRSGTGE